MSDRKRTPRIDASMTYVRAMRPEELLTPRPAGLFCPPGGFHIDPVRPVARALITHAHSDPAPPGHGAALATAETLALTQRRYGETLRRDGVAVTLHPAGHVLGSAQVAVERSGLTIVASGDYKTVADPT